MRYRGFSGLSREGGVRQPPADGDHEVWLGPDEGIPLGQVNNSETKNRFVYGIPNDVEEDFTYSQN